jgi:glycosyltransferase involved in cell wall biosynthesis
VEIHQVLVSASPADAITDSALRQRALLRRIGPSEVYALHVHPDVACEVRRLQHYPSPVERAGRERNLLLFHASIGQPEVVSFLAHQGERIVVLYHNITPSRYFAELDPHFAGLLEAGRSELRFLADKVDLALAVSAYNAAELVAMGFPDVRVSPLLVDVSGPSGVPVDQGMVAGLERVLGGQGGPTLLYVGQLLPHKRPDLLLQAFHVLSTHLLPEARLIMAGIGRMAPYRRSLERLIHELGLYRATFTGHVTPAQLAACWQLADGFVTASEHEGFCMPLAEAMAHQVPVLARRCAAIPETVGDAGLLVDADAGPELLAEAMAELLLNQGLRAELNRRAAARLPTFHPDRAAATFLRHLLSVV